MSRMKPRCAEGLKDTLDRAGYAADAVESAEDAAEFMAVAPFDLVLLDVNLPGQDGISLMKDWRRSKIDTPIILLTARRLAGEGRGWTGCR